MVKVTLGHKTLAESNRTIVVEGNHYFPPSSLNTSLFTESPTHTFCPWKGEASYYNVDVGGGESHSDVAWYYPETITDKAKPIESYVAFYKVIEPQYYHEARLTPDQNKVEISDD